MKKLTLIILLLFALNCTKAQLWQVVGGGTSGSVRDLYVDSIANMLYVVGQFDYAGDSAVGNIAGWKNGAWHIVGYGTNYVSCCNPVLSIQGFNNDLFIAGMQNTNDNIKYLSRWNGSGWLECGSPNSLPIGLAVLNGELFCFGWFDTISDQNIRNVAKWTGTEWEQFGTVLPFNSPGGQKLVCGEYYNGKYYVAGNASGDNGFQDIAGWDGIQWFTLDNGVIGTDVWDIKAYNNYLFVGGSFLEINGNASDYIMAWDGQNWFNPFPGVQFDFYVRDFTIINNELYIVGMHHILGDTNSYGLAKFDGVNFCSIGGANNFLQRIVGFNDTLYAATDGAFDGDTLKWIYSMPVNTPPNNCIYQPLNIDPINYIELIIYPNPFSDYLNIEIPDDLNIQSITCLNTMGQIVFVQNATFANEQIYLGYLPNGLYTIVLATNDGIMTRKIVKM